MKTVPAAASGVPVAEYRQSIDALDRAIVRLKPTITRPYCMSINRH